MNNLLLFGGTFDPIHSGHLKTAAAIQNYFHFDRVVFLPCKSPVLAKNSLSSTSEHRVAMLKLALAKQASHHHFHLDLREIRRESPSYTVLSLESFREELGPDFPITLLLGLDAFAQLSRWHQWARLIELANLLVMERTGFDESQILKPVQDLLLQHQTTDLKALLNSPYGLIALFDAGSPGISSSAIRDGLAKGLDLSACVPAEVLDYIVENQLYYL